MAYIDGAYTTSATIIKDLARVLCTGNMIKEPKELEKVVVKQDGAMNYYVDTTRQPFDGTPDFGFGPGVIFYDEGMALLGSLIGTPEGIDNPTKIIITGGVVNIGDILYAEYDVFRDAELVFPAKGSGFATLFEQLDDQFSRINEEQRCIIKMTTTTDKKPLVEDPFNENPDNDVRSASMYIEFKKPKYVINHETMDYDDVIMKNNHHIFTRMIDKVDDETGIIDPNAIISNWAKFSWSLDYREEVEILPLENEIDNGEGGATARPVEEVIHNLAKVELPEFCDAQNMNIQFYVHCDNDKINIVIKGNDDVAVNDYLISWAYIGKIKSFIDETTGFSYANDIIGNFALTVGSSTLPLEYPRELPPANLDVDMNAVLVDIKAFDDSYTGIDGEKGSFDYKLSISETLVEGPPGLGNFLNFFAPQTRVNYRVVFVGDDFESFPSNVLSATVYKYLYTSGSETKNVTQFTENLERIDDFDYRTNELEYKMEPRISIVIPAEIQSSVKKIKVYKSIVDSWDDEGTFSINASIDNQIFIQALPPKIEGPATKETEFFLLEEYVLQPGDIIDEKFIYIDTLGDEKMTENDDYIPNRTFVTRYDNGNAIKAIKFSDRFGEDSTATGVNDILMFKTRIGAPYQKHFAAFMTPDEFMSKYEFNISKWTGMVHITPVYVAHPNDGYRGELMDVFFLTGKNMRNGEILTINEGQEDEKKYKLFLVNAPFSCLNSSPDYQSAVAIRYIKYE